MNKIIKFGLIATVLAAFAFAGCQKDDEIINNDDNNQYKIDSVNREIELVSKCFPDGVFDNITPADKSNSVDVFDKTASFFQRAYKYSYKD